MVDIADNRNTAGTVAVGGSVTGEIETAGDRDWFRVNLEAGVTYQFDLEGRHTGAGTLHDPYLHGIYDADGNLLGNTTDDDGGVLYNSRVTFTPTEDGAYYVAAGAFSRSNNTGTYRLTVADVTPDLAAGIDTTGRVAVGGSVTGRIEFEDDRDWFTVTLEEGESYRIDLEAVNTGAGASPDPRLLGIYDADGVLIGNTADDNGGEGRNSRIIFTASTDGTYYVAAGFASNELGAYRLSVTDTNSPDDDFTAGTDTTGAVDIAAGDASVTGEIEAPGDRDWFAVALEAGRSYRFDLKGSATQDGRFGSLADPYLYGIHDADGNAVAGTTDDDGGYGANSRVAFTPDEGGTYYVAAGSAGNGIGTYTLRARDISHLVSSLDDLADYMTSFESAAPPSNTQVSVDLTGLSENGRQLARWALEAWEAVADIEFVEAAGNTRKIIFLEHNHLVSYVEPGIELTFHPKTGEPMVVELKYVNVTVFGSGTDRLVQDLPFQTYLHEIGHALGLEHPGDYNGKGVVFDPDMNSAIDSWQVSLMSYFGQDENPFVKASYAVPVTPMMVDILAIQKLYGAPDSASATAGDTLWGRSGNPDGSLGYVNAALAAGRPVAATIYDRDGIDTLDLSASTGNNRIDLRGEQFSDVNGLIGNLGIARGTVIENLVSGSGNDNIAGNDADNDIDGGDGDDTIDGDGGDDTLDGGKGDDVLYGRRGDDLLRIGGGDDTASGGGGAVTFEFYGSVIGANTVTDFERDVDMLRLDDALWTGSLNAAQVVERFATVVNGNVLFDFGDGNTITLTGVAATTSLADDLEIFSATGVVETPVVEDDDSDGTLNADTTETVTVIDANEVPAFGSASYAFDLAENADGSATAVSLGSVSATDPDEDAVSYSIEGGNAGGLFAIDADTGALTYTGPGEDYETDARSHALTVQASDGSLHADVAVLVNITDVDETADDFTAATETAWAIDLTVRDIHFAGHVDSAGDIDWFKVTLTAGKTYRFDLKGSGTQEGRWGNLPDPYLYGLHDADGNVVAGTTDDNSGWGDSRNARVHFMPTEDGTWYLAVGGKGDQVGSYTLRTRVFEDDFAAFTNAAGAVEAGGEATGAVDFNGDRDWFAVELEAGKTYQFDLEGAQGGDDPLSDPYLYGIHDADGDLISGTADDNGGDGNNSRVTFTATEDATWYVAVGAAGNQLGDYTLFVEEFL